MSFGVRYSHKWLDKTIEDIGVNVPGVGEVFYIANPGSAIGEHSPRRSSTPTRPARRRRSASTTASSSASQAPSEQPLVDRHQLPDQPARTATTPVSPARTKTAAPARTSIATSTASTCRSTRPASRSTAGCRPIGRSTSRRQTTYDLPWGTNLGAFFQVGSGQPLSQQVTDRRCAGLQPRPRQPGTLADLLADGPPGPARLPAAGPHPRRRGREHQQPVRSGHVHEHQQHAVP